MAATGFGHPPNDAREMDCDFRSAQSGRALSRRRRRRSGAQGESGGVGWQTGAHVRSADVGFSYLLTTMLVYRLVLVTFCPAASGLGGGRGLVVGCRYLVKIWVWPVGEVVPAFGVAGAVGGCSMGASTGRLLVSLASGSGV